MTDSELNVGPSSVQFSRSVMSDSLQPRGLQHARSPCASPIPELTQTHVRDAIQSSHPLLSPSPPALNLSQHHGLFKWVSSSHQVAKLLELQLQHQSSQWIFRRRLITLQYRGGFCHILTWISHGCSVHVSPHPETSPHPIPLGGPSALALSALLHALNLRWSSVLHMVIYMFQCYSLKSSQPLLPLSPSLFFTSMSPLLPCM